MDATVRTNSTNGNFLITIPLQESPIIIAPQDSSTLFNAVRPLRRLPIRRELQQRLRLEQVSSDHGFQRRGSTGGYQCCASSTRIVLAGFEAKPGHLPTSQLRHSRPCFRIYSSLRRTTGNLALSLRALPGWLLTCRVIDDCRRVRCFFRGKFDTCHSFPLNHDAFPATVERTQLDSGPQTSFRVSHTDLYHRERHLWRIEEYIYPSGGQSGPGCWSWCRGTTQSAYTARLVPTARTGKVAGVYERSMGYWNCSWPDFGWSLLGPQGPYLGKCVPTKQWFRY